MRSLPTILITTTIALTAMMVPPSTPGHVKGTGESVKKKLEVAPFHGIEVYGSVDVEVVRAAVQRVEVEAQANITELITTDVKNGVWSVRTSQGYSTDKPFVVRINVPHIDRVRITGSGDVKGMDSFDVTDLDLAIFGSGDIQFKTKATNVRIAIEGSGDVKVGGTCTSLKAEVAGSGDVKAQDLMTTDADVEVQGSGNIHVHATGALRARIMGSGDVIMHTNPLSVQESVDGSGEVRPAN